ERRSIFLLEAFIYRRNILSTCLFGSSNIIEKKLIHTSKMPSKSQCNKWKSKVQLLLEDPEGFNLFHEFLIKHEEKCEKDIGEFSRYTDFWKDYKNYKKLEGSSQKEAAMNIFNKFLNSEAEKKIDIVGPDDVINTLRENVINIDKCEKIEHTVNLSTMYNDVEIGMLLYLERGGCYEAYEDFCKELKPDRRMPRFQCRLM
ncbi:unnamed protein product, partial [Meganyctiphanes norvegica]